MRKISLAFFLPVAILEGGIVVLIYQTETKSYLAIKEVKESEQLDLQLKTTTCTFHSY